VLVVAPFSEHLFASRIERQQITIVVGAPVKDTTSAIDGGVDQGVWGAAVLGLAVKDRLPSFPSRVLPQEHMFRPPPPSDCGSGSNSACRGTSLVPFDRLAVEWIL